MIPNWFTKGPIPQTIPRDMQRVITRFAKSKNKEMFLKKSFHYIAKRFRRDPFGLATNFFDLFRDDISYLWHTKKHVHCTSLNYVLRVMLIKSNLFSEQDISILLGVTKIIAPHQQLQVKIRKNLYYVVDPYLYRYGVYHGSRLPIKGSFFFDIPFPHAMEYKKFMFRSPFLSKQN